MIFSLVPATLRTSQQEEILWNASQKDIPPLIAALEKLV
jgi:hypothetical protein